MIKHKDHFHGSDLEKIEEIYGIKKEEIVSFSRQHCCRSSYRNGYQIFVQCGSRQNR